MNHLPDFIIIGAMKCATSTLHEQLARQPGIFMSSPKEPNFFSDDDQWVKGIDWYSSLFGNAPDHSLCGESSTHYTKLPTYPNTIERMRAHLPDTTRFIYVIRDPIDRLISQYVHEWTQRVILCSLDEAIDRHPELVAYSRYSMQLAPYVETFGRSRVLATFAERVRAQPQNEFRRICEFIGFSGQSNWHTEVAKQNVSSDRVRASGWRDAIVNFPPAAAVRRALIPKSVRNRVRGWWTMKDRPTLSPDRRNHLRAIFNQDLAILGEWFGVTLTCDTFSDVAKQSELQWSNVAEVAGR